jgi:hypothetical protein
MTGLRFALALLLAGGLSGCATSRVENSWVDPSATPKSLAFDKVIVVARTRDGAIRRATEDAMDREMSSSPRGMSGALVVDPSYPLLDDDDLGAVSRARPKVEAAGYDGAVLVSFVSSEQQVRVDPPTYVGGFWGGGWGGGSMLYSPGAVHTDTLLRLQVSIYSLEEGKLIWSGVSRTLNPDEVDKLVAGVAQAVREDLTERGLLP